MLCIATAIEEWEVITCSTQKTVRVNVDLSVNRVQIPHRGHSNLDSFPDKGGCFALRDDLSAILIATDVMSTRREKGSLHSKVGRLDYVRPC